MNGGPRDNRALEQRPDVLTYTSAPLDAPLVITGPVTVELFAGSSRPHTDFFARLCDVGPEGHVGEHHRRHPPPERRGRAAGAVTIDLWPTAHQFRPGHRIRLQVSSGAHPRYARNLGRRRAAGDRGDAAAARQAVYHDPARPSAVLLPVTGGA